MGNNGDSQFWIQDKQCRKIAGKLWAENYPRNLVWDFLDGISCETKWNPDDDIQHKIMNGRPGYVLKTDKIEFNIKVNLGGGGGGGR